jgi:hypothetical protein
MCLCFRADNAYAELHYSAGMAPRQATKAAHSTVGFRVDIPTQDIAAKKK